MEVLDFDDKAKGTLTGLCQEILEDLGREWDY